METAIPIRAPAEAWSTGSVVAFLIALRLLNALSVRTFFQPDEYFQSLEPAWQLAFGDSSGAWITWEWAHQLRSSIHPTIFALFYRAASEVAGALRFSAASRADILIAVPKILQGVCAAVGDLYTWKLARRVYGCKSMVPLVTLAVTVCNPWQWFCSTRTLSNSLETTLTAMALCYWPWHALSNDGRLESSSTGPQEDAWRKRDERAAAKAANTKFSGLRRSLLVAATACILRPTNLFIWASLAVTLILHLRPRDRLIFVADAAVCGVTVLGFSLLADRAFYGVWTLPALQFLYFNIARSLAVFYGTSPWHYYLTQGIPLLLTTALPFCGVGLWKALTRGVPQSSATANVEARFYLALAAILTTTVLSLVAHKEVRFLYPLLPALHLFAAESLTEFIGAGCTGRPTWRRMWLSRKLIIIGLLSMNVIVAYYTAMVHQSGVIAVVDYIRRERENRSAATTERLGPMSVGFLMPCHSTPWRSHLVHADIQAWALTCEPPIHVEPADRSRYMDEADQFYHDPISFLQQRMSNDSGVSEPRPGDKSLSTRNTWPEYLVFFEQLTRDVGLASKHKPGKKYGECWRAFNTHWHDDWRRKGDVVVWCMR